LFNIFVVQIIYSISMILVFSISFLFILFIYLVEILSLFLGPCLHFPYFFFLL
jgi:hypothetical protein